MRTVQKKTLGLGLVLSGAAVAFYAWRSKDNHDSEAGEKQKTRQQMHLGIQLVLIAIVCYYTYKSY